MASICNDEWGCFGVVSGHDRKTLSLSVRQGCRSSQRPDGGCQPAQNARLPVREQPWRADQTRSSLPQPPHSRHKAAHETHSPPDIPTFQPGNCCSYAARPHDATRQRPRHRKLRPAVGVDGPGRPARGLRHGTWHSPCGRPGCCTQTACSVHPCCARARRSGAHGRSRSRSRPCSPGSSTRGPAARPGPGHAAAVCRRHQGRQVLGRVPAGVDEG